MRWLNRVSGWLDDRLGVSDTIIPIITHPMPRSVNWWYVFGSATLTAFIFQVITGVALTLNYVPSAASAFDSIKFITEEAVLGSVIRGIHFYGASAMVVLVFTHMAQVFLTGSYKFPRELNWITGVFLMISTLGMAFTGQLLRWNQDSYWAVVLTAQQASRIPIIGGILTHLTVAGDVVGGQTLTRFFATHVFLLPALMFLIIAIHVYLVVHVGISEWPRPGHPVNPATYKKEYDEILHRDGMPFFPDFAWKDVVFALAIGAVVLALSIIAGPPHLGEPADPTNVQAHPRPDWYFLWYFALLSVIPHATEDWVMVLFPPLAILFLLALPFVANRGERHPARRPWAIGAVVLSVLTVGVLIRIGSDAPWVPNLSGLTLPPTVTQGLGGAESQGARLFASRGCIACHQIGGTGGLRGPELDDVGARLTHEQLISQIVNGSANMPGYRDTISPIELSNLVAFLETRDGSAQAAEQSGR